MGEIKSTIDIIMEKTKGLTITEEDIGAFKKNEMEKKICGIMQKFLDGFMSMERLKKEIRGVENQYNEEARQIFIKECAGRIDLEEDNTPVLNALENMTGEKAIAFRTLLREFHKELEQQKKLREKELKDLLERQGISGSAVVPNLDADSEWNNYVTELKARLQKKFHEARDKEKIKSPI